MSRQTLSSILFWAIAAASAAVLVLLALVLAGVVPVDSPSDATATEQEAAASEPTVPTASSEPKQTATTRTTAPAAPATTIVVVTASRGDSWFSARLGSENGRLLDERVLAQGESVRFQGRKIWLSIGASGNVDVTVDGERTTLPPGTVSVVLTRSQATES